VPNTPLERGEAIGGSFYNQIEYDDKDNECLPSRQSSGYDMRSNGVMPFSMVRRIAMRSLIVALILSVCVLATQAVGHWHDNPVDEAHCQVCHIGQAAIPQPTVQVVSQTAVSVARFTPTEKSSRDLKPVRTSSIPRAPPA